MSINRVVISGNLTRDPELRSTSGGTSVLRLGVAVNDRRKNQQTGEWEDSPNFIDVAVFGARGEALSRFLSKGSKVAIEGKLRWRQWETPQGDKRSAVEVIADEVEFLSSRDGGSGGYSSPSGPSGGSSADELGEEEIPF
jgi:single-strand DNA-binding protein